MSADVGATPAVLRAKASRARAFACQLPAGDSAVARLLEFAAELETSADVLERQAGGTAAQPAEGVRVQLNDFGVPGSQG
jgi:hypothetical protein